jgi:hypothetical protein
MKLLFVALVLSFVNISVTFSADCVVQDSQNKIQKMSIEEKIEYLQKQINELKKLLKKERQNRKKSAQIICGKEKDNIKVKFGGQYRINFYSARNEKNNVQGDHDDQRAARLRIRQNIDFIFSKNLRTHLQIELQHVSDNVTTTDLRLGNKSTSLSVRHAVITYVFNDNNLIQAGILPLHDYFHDTLFSSEWDYNPLAACIQLTTSKGGLRLFAADLKEGKEDVAQDDFLHYQADYMISIKKYHFVISGTALNIQEDPRWGKNDAWHYNWGFAYSFPLEKGWKINGFIAGSHTDKELIGTNKDANGIALLVELTGKIKHSKFGFLVSHATGDKDGRGFLSPMSFAKTFGYWGYTGILTVQGATDTGFDFDAVNISNNGLGLTTVQIKCEFPLTDKFSTYTAAGWFGNTNPPEGRNSMLGVDIIAMGKYKLTDLLSLDIGFAYAHLMDSISGYSQGIQHSGKIIFNQNPGQERDKFVTFGRLQVEF